MTSLASLRKPNAYDELPAPVVDRPFDHLIIKREDDAFTAAQRHLIAISLESYQSATKPERVVAILAELKQATTVTDPDFLAVAQYALKNATSNLAYIAHHRPAAPVVKAELARLKAA